MDYKIDSRKIVPGDGFICLPGGELFIDDAMARGAVEVLRMSRQELGAFANQKFGFPSKKLHVVGVTGTNGKTTVTHLITHGLAASGAKPMVLGTLNAALTTPESYEISSRMKAHLDNGGTHFVMEVSSHAIDQDRIAGIEFEVKVLTNITQDHLDYHGTFEAYRGTKMRFMNSPGVSFLPENYERECLGFEVPVPGEFNIKNFKAAVAVLRYFNVSESVIAESMAVASAPPGRFEPVKAGQPYDIIVDYAHTPDGLENVATEARRIANKQGGRLIIVFGCGGDRDRSKRPKMGRIAEALADSVVVTSDNPRSERPEDIIAEILVGMAFPEKIVVKSDRRRAIRWAIANAVAGDVVLVAGKGHETVQILNGETIHFDDREECRKAVEERHEGIH